MWKADPERVHLIDVRTPEEYVFVGHAEMARNIPLALCHTSGTPMGQFAWSSTPSSSPT